MTDATERAAQPTAGEALASPLSEAMQGEVTRYQKDLKGLARDNATGKKVDGAVQVMLRMLVDDSQLISDDALETLDALIKRLDDKLSEQVNVILHHPEFQQIEGTWRGLEHLVFATETSKDLKIRVLNVTLDDLRAECKTFKGAAWDQSNMFKKLYGGYDQPGGQPMGVILGDYHFTHKSKDVDVLAFMGKIGSAAHAPFIAGADPAILDRPSWESLNEPRDLEKVFEDPDWAVWQAFRQHPDARYVGLTLPRILAREPYGPDNFSGAFQFTEECDGSDHSKYLWSNSVFAMGANITQAFKYYGWCSCIRGKNSGGEVSGLKVHTFKSGGKKIMKCPTEVAIGDRRERELAKLGFTSLLHWQNTNTAAFMAAPSVYMPTEYDDPDATANSKMNGALPYVFAVCRFAHYLKVMVREAIGRFTSQGQLEKWLNDWIVKYKCPDAEPTQEKAALQPLADAKVVVTEIPGNPGWYDAVFELKPIFQLEGLTASMRLVTKFRAEKAAGGS